MKTNMLLKLVCVVTGLAVLPSISNAEIRINAKCTDDNTVCSFQLGEATVSTYQDESGKTVEKVENWRPLQATSYDIQWGVDQQGYGGAISATNNVLAAANLPLCKTDVCGNDLTTGAVFYGDQDTFNIYAQGTIEIDGQTYHISKEDNTVSIKVNQKKPTFSFIIPDESTPENFYGNIVENLNANSSFAHASFVPFIKGAITVICYPGWTIPETYDSNNDLPLNSDKATTINTIDMAAVVQDEYGNITNGQVQANEEYNQYKDGKDTKWQIGCEKA